jgi:hypothetical protein
MPRNNEDARSGLDRADIPGFEGTLGMLNNLVSKYAPNANKRESSGNSKDPRVFVDGSHVGFQDQEGNFMNMDQDTAAQKHFAAQGYNKGTAGDMLKKSKARIAESTEAGKASNQDARKASKKRTADREEARRQERGE